jgi:hypothetical protein
LQTGGDGLPEVDHAVDDDARDRRADRRVAQIDLILVGRGPGLRELRLGRAARLDRLFEFLPGNVFLFEQGLHAHFVGAGQIECRRDIADVGRRLPRLRGEQRVVEFEQCLALLDLVVEVDIQPGHRSGDLRADVDQHHRVERAVGRYRLRHSPRSMACSL